MNKLIINFAPTGMIPNKSTTPHVPISVNEIVDDVLMAAELGISIAHLHARDEKSGEPTSNQEAYGNIIDKIRKYDKKIILCVSLSGRKVSDPELRCDPLNLRGDLKPDMGSLTLSSLNFSQSASINSPSTIEFIAKKMLQCGVMPELEIFDLGMANAYKYLSGKNLLSPPYYFNVISGNLYGAQANYAHFSCFKEELSNCGVLSFGGIGAQQIISNMLSIAHGFHVRVGLEDNIWLDKKRTKLATNKQLLERVINIADINEIDIASPSDTRLLIGLNGGLGNYGRKELVD